jgi:hypothetical protein
MQFNDYKDCLQQNTDTENYQPSQQLTAENLTCQISGGDRYLHNTQQTQQTNINVLSGIPSNQAVSE